MINMSVLNKTILLVLMLLLPSHSQELLGLIDCPDGGSGNNGGSEIFEMTSGRFPGTGMEERLVGKEIRNAVPIAAEYCLLESSKNMYGKWEIRLINILDTTKIHPYEYEDLRNCIWKDEPELHLMLGPYYYVDVDTRGKQYNGYNNNDIPETVKTIADYHDIFKDKFYIRTKYQKIWSSKIFEDKGIVLNSNYIGVVPISWALGDFCLPKKEEKKDNTYYTIAGNYNIRIIGKCSKADLKKLKEMGNLDYPP